MKFHGVSLKRKGDTLSHEEGHDLKYVLTYCISPANYINRKADAAVKHKLRITRPSSVRFASSGGCLLEKRHIYVHIFNYGRHLEVDVNH